MEIPTSSSLVKKGAAELSLDLDADRTTCVELATAFLDQIEAHNSKGIDVNAIISLCPRHLVLERATLLDNERKAGRVRSKLHGIPILVKDSIITSEELGMPSTAGAAVFKSIRAKWNATVIDRLLDAGLIILGKTNMTEFCGLKSNNTPMGWSAVAGQTRSPYRRPSLPEKNQPIAGGSSSGSAVALATFFAPLALGTETSGSVVYPACLSGVYAIKLTPKVVPDDGLFKLSESFDSIGVMARSPDDLGILMSTMGVPGLDPQYERTEGLGGLKIGVLERAWGVDESAKEKKWDTDQVKLQWDDAVEILRNAGAKVVSPVGLASPEVLTHEGNTLITVAYHEFPEKVKDWISSFHDPNVKTLCDIVEWNESHHEEALPERKFLAAYTTQTELRKVLDAASPSKPLQEAAGVLRGTAAEHLNQILQDNDVDIILSNSEAQLVSYAACAGWPIGTIPVGRLAENGQPWGMFCLCRQGREDTLLRLMSGWNRMRLT